MRLRGRLGVVRGSRREWAVNLHSAAGHWGCQLCPLPPLTLLPNHRPPQWCPTSVLQHCCLFKMIMSRWLRSEYSLSCQPSHGLTQTLVCITPTQKFHSLIGIANSVTPPTPSHHATTDHRNENNAKCDFLMPFFAFLFLLYCFYFFNIGFCVLIMLEVDVLLFLSLSFSYTAWGKEKKVKARCINVVWMFYLWCWSSRLECITYNPRHADVQRKEQWQCYMFFLSTLFTRPCCSFG